MTASRDGHRELVKYLLDFKGGVPPMSANKEATNKYGVGPLNWAAWNGHLEIVRMLMDAGANKDARDEWGNTALHRAAENGHVKVVEYLVSKQCDKEAEDKDGRTPLIRAAEKAQAEVVRVLQERGAVMSPSSRSAVLRVLY